MSNLKQMEVPHSFTPLVSFKCSLDGSSTWRLHTSRRLNLCHKVAAKALSDLHREPPQNKIDIRCLTQHSTSQNRVQNADSRVRRSREAGLWLLAHADTVTDYTLHFINDHSVSSADTFAMLLPKIALHDSNTRSQDSRSWAGLFDFDVIYACHQSIGIRLTRSIINQILQNTLPSALTESPYLRITLIVQPASVPYHPKRKPTPTRLTATPNNANSPRLARRARCIGS